MESRRIWVGVSEMRYSISGTTTDRTDIRELNITSRMIENIEDTYKIIEFGNGEVSFEIWVDTVEQKDILFDDLKLFIDENGGVVKWHECSHWDDVKTPCVIAEAYPREGR